MMKCMFEYSSESFSGLRFMNVSRPKPLTFAISSFIALGSVFAQGAVLEEIVVTAQKRSESVMDVPISISAMDSEALQQRNIRGLSDISRSTPSLAVSSNNTFGYQSVSIRGISSGTGAATTGIYIDDMPVLQRNDDLGPPISPHVFDLERVEVLRGPQGTLYGAGAEGGAIRYITPQPSLDNTSLSLGTELGYTDGGDKSYQYSVTGGMPLIEGKLGFRAGVFYRDEGGFVDRVNRVSGEKIDSNINASETTAARFALTWQATENLSFTPSVFYQKTEIDDLDLYWAALPEYQTASKVSQPNEDEWNMSSLVIDYDMEHFSVRSISSYMSRKNFQINDWSDTEASQLQSFLPPFTGDIDLPGLPEWTAAMYADIDQEVFTQEVRFTSIESDSPFSWVGGVYYQKSDTERVRTEYEDLDAATMALVGAPVEFILGSPSLTGPLSSSLGPVGYYEAVDNSEEELAAFANVTYQMTDTLSLTLGTRVARTEFNNSRIQDGPWNAGFSEAKGTQTDTPVTPKINVTYEPTEDTMIYASAAKGYRIGGGNASYAGNPVCQIDLQGSDAPSTYDSDSVWSYEVGSKNRLADGRAELSFSLFHIDWTNIQSLIVMPTCGNLYTDNLGEATSQGADVEFDVQLNDDFRLTVSMGYTNAEYSEDTLSDFGSLLAKDGQELPLPKFTASAALFYQHAFDGFDTYANLSYNYAGSYDRTSPEGVFGADSEVRDAESVGSASMRAGVTVGQLDLSLFVENLTNESPEILRTRVTDLTDNFMARTLRPRTLGMSLQYDF